MRKLFTIATIIAVATLARAEIRQETAVYVGITNATAAALSPISSTGGPARGELERIAVTIAGANKTNSLIIADSDGYLILSNEFITGTSTVWFNTTNLPFLGYTVTGFSASGGTNDCVTNTVKILFNRY